ncbi:MAG: J domain-containing protein [Gemmatimonadales bacterium]|nr:J domain-containing protein [Gemmatimonadales bacterium]
MEPRRAYRVLGLLPGKSPEEVKRAYRDLAQVWHPDRFPADSRLAKKAENNLKRINEAYWVPSYSSSLSSSP